MALRTDKGCSTPPSVEPKEIHRYLLNLFSPLVFFESGEQFFPVDLPSAVAQSSLWKVDRTTKPPGTNKEKDAGQIVSNDLRNASVDHYTTVAGNGSILKKVEGKPPFNLPVPLLKQVLKAYSDGTVQAELTMYGTVCTPRKVAGGNTVHGATPINADVAHAVAEGLLLSYSFYFPYRVSPELESEGDWSGVSLLLREKPESLAQAKDKTQLERFLPVLACYYRKTVDGAPPSPYFVAGSKGFRRWKDVKRGHEPTVGKDTHPKVYVSRGRHNCYYEPGVTNVPLTPPWNTSRYTPDGIEDGAYTAGPAANALTGGGIEDFPWWGYMLFPPFAALVACATGCEYPAHFDPSGIPAGYQDGEDRSDSKGYEALPASAGSSFPKTPAGQAPSKQLAVRMRYVDLDDADTDARWSYPGAWGAATKVQAPYAWDPTEKHVWGWYRGARRPNLAAWFMWNLFLDGIYGCNGNPELTRKPF